MSQREVILVLQGTVELLVALKLPGVEEASRRAAAADERALELSCGSWHRELDSLCASLREALGEMDVAAYRTAKLLKVRLPELPTIDRLVREVKACWDQRPGVIRSG